MSGRADVVLAGDRRSTWLLRQRRRRVQPTRPRRGCYCLQARAGHGVGSTGLRTEPLAPLFCVSTRVGDKPRAAGLALLASRCCDRDNIQMSEVEKEAERPKANKVMLRQPWQHGCRVPPASVSFCILLSITLQAW